MMFYVPLCRLRWGAFRGAFVFALCSLLTCKHMCANKLQHLGGGNRAKVLYCANPHFLKKKNFEKLKKIKNLIYLRSKRLFLFG